MQRIQSWFCQLIVVILVLGFGVFVCFFFYWPEVCFSSRSSRFALGNTSLSVFSFLLVFSLAEVDVF